MEGKGKDGRRRIGECVEGKGRMGGGESVSVCGGKGEDGRRRVGECVEGKGRMGGGESVSVWRERGGWEEENR